MKVDKEIEKIEKDRDLEIDKIRERLLGEFSCFDEDEEFPSESSYVMDKCGDDPITKQTNRYSCPQKPKLSIWVVLSGAICLLGIILTIIGFINVWTKDMDVPFFQGLLAIAGFIMFSFLLSGFKAEKEEYHKKMDLYVKEKHSNDELKTKHNEWNKKVINAKKEYQIECAKFNENHEKRKKEYFVATEVFEKEETKINEKYNDQKYSTLCASRDKMHIELVETVKDFDDKIPKSKKFDLDLFREDNSIEIDYELLSSVNSKVDGMLRMSFINDLLPELSLYVRGNDMLSALVEYYKESHNEELERERIKLEEERNEIERERIRAYEKQQKENRRQQEKFERQREENQRQMEYERRQQEKQTEKDRQALAKQEADWAAARIRCAQCKFYSTCCSMSRNKKPYAPCFKSKN